MWIGPGESRGLSSWLRVDILRRTECDMILGGNKPVQRPASNSTARKRREAEMGESSTDALRGAPSPLPHVSDWTSGGRDLDQFEYTLTRRALRQIKAEAWEEGANAAVEPVNTGTRMTLRARIPFPADENPYRVNR